MHDENVASAASETFESVKVLPPLTFGENAVELGRSSSGSEAVTVCKKIFAQAIDQMHAILESEADLLAKQMATEAINKTVEASRWAVKTITSIK